METVRVFPPKKARFVRKAILAAMSEKTIPRSVVLLKLDSRSFDLLNQRLNGMDHLEKTLSK